ncbi:hypothetical protein CDD81_1752 [Ophiocordyceps australis]|uniref:Uncharacterized protein n=1 Tax=Ophiocordyceps australis TaxID=1399860 RepID=A0A2C5YD83_9HYPO|nr:hypothetical protein CDD81_1752 [Ophiocordyceps australis]
MRTVFLKRWPNLALWTKGLGPMAVATAALLPWYILNVKQAFTEANNALDRGGEVTAIIPGLGCWFRLVSDMEKNIIHEPRRATSNSLCLIGDALLFTPLMPLGLIMRVVQAILDGMPLTKTVIEARDDAWNNEYQKLLDRFTSEEGKARLEKSYSTEMAAIIFVTSEQRGLLAAADTVLLKNATTDKERAAVNRRVSEAHVATQRTMCARIQDLRQQFEKVLPRKEWLYLRAAEFTQKYIEELEEEIKRRHVVSEGFVTSYQRTWYPGLSDMREFELLKTKLRWSAIMNAKGIEFASKVKSIFDGIFAIPSECICADKENYANRPRQELEDALLCATANGYSDIVEWLNNWLLQPKMHDADGFTALMLAVKRGNVAIVELLAQRAGSGLPASKAEAAQSLASKLKQDDIVALLQTEVKADALLSLASKEGRVGVVELFRKRAVAYVDLANSFNNTALMLAAMHGHQDMVRLLLETEAVNPRAQNNDGETALTLAAARGHEQIVSALLAAVDRKQKLEG